MAKTCRTEGPCAPQDCDCCFYDKEPATTPTYMIAHGNTAVQAARIIAGVAASRDADRPTVAPQQCGDARQAYDKNGREIMVGDVLKVYHFTAALRRKKHYMYKQVVARVAYSDRTPYLKVSHLDLTDDTYVIFCDGERLPDYEIVDSIKCDHHDRPTAAP